MRDSPLNFSFTVEHGMSDSDIQKLWDDTIATQDAMDRFLAGEFSEAEMTDVLSFYDVDLDETEAILENNLIILGVV
jgi:hypothetical protein